MPVKMLCYTVTFIRYVGGRPSYETVDKYFSSQAAFNKWAPSSKILEVKGPKVVEVEIKGKNILPVLK